MQDSNVAGGDDINRNLRSFAARRTDIFGDQEVGIGEMVGAVSEQVLRPTFLHALLHLNMIE